MAKINELFLKQIFKENEIEVEETSIGVAVSKMSQFAIPRLVQNDTDDYQLYYFVDFNTINKSDIDEAQAFELKQCGWELDKTEQHIIKKL